MSCFLNVLKDMGQYSSCSFLWKKHGPSAIIFYFAVHNKYDLTRQTPWCSNDTLIVWQKRKLICRRGVEYDNSSPVYLKQTDMSKLKYDIFHIKLVHANLLQICELFFWHRAQPISFNFSMVNPFFITFAFLILVVDVQDTVTFFDDNALSELSIQTS